MLFIGAMIYGSALVRKILIYRYNSCAFPGDKIESEKTFSFFRGMLGLSLNVFFSIILKKSRYVPEEKLKLFQKYSDFCYHLFLFSFLSFVVICIIIGKLNFDGQNHFFRNF